MHYYPLLRYARETKLRLPQARVATLDRIPDAAEACRRDELFDSPNLIAGMRLLHDDSAADHDTVTVAYTDGSRLLVLARAIESDPAGMRALLAEGQRATRFDGTDMDYNIDKDDSVEFRFDGSCRHEEAFCFAVTPMNARRHRRVSCPMNNHALPENHDLDCSPVYQTAARVGTAWWVAALMVDLAEIGAKGRPVIGFDVVRRRQRDVRQESCWSERLSSGSVDPRSFGHLLLSQSAIAPIALDWGPGRYKDNTVTVTLPPGRGSVRVSCEYRPRSSKPATGALPALSAETMVTAELREGAATEVSLALHVPATAPEGRIALRIDRGGERGEPLYAAEYPNDERGVIYRHGDASTLSADALDPAPHDPDFLRKKRAFICSRLPDFERSPSFTLRAKDGSVAFDLMRSGVLDELAAWIESLFPTETDRLLAAVLLAKGPAFTNHADPFTSLEYGLTPLSTLRLGAGDCTSRATVLAGILSRLRDPQRRRYQAYPTLVLGHVITTVRTARGWIPLDPTYGHFYYLHDNRTLATAEELSRDLEGLVDRVDARRRCEFRHPRTHTRFHFGRLVYPDAAPPW